MLFENWKHLFEIMYQTAPRFSFTYELKPFLVFS